MADATDVLGPQVDDLPAPGEAPATSLLGQLQARRKEAQTASQPTLALVIAGYKNGLAAVYRFPDGGGDVAMKAAERERAEADKEARVNGSADLLIACVASLVGRRPDGTLVNLDDDSTIEAADTLDPGYPALRFNKTLARKLGINVEREMKRPGRYVARQIFSPRFDSTGIYEGDLALIAQSNFVFEWLQDTEGGFAEELSGE